MSAAPVDPLGLVSDQVDAYNDRDLERTLAYYAEDAVILGTLAQARSNSRVLV